MAISIGSVCEDLAASGGSGRTNILLDGAASDTGVIDAFDIYPNANMSAVDIGTFYLDSGTTYVCRDGDDCNLDPASGACRSYVGGGTDFTSLTVETGDFLGAYIDAHAERATSGYSGFLDEASNNCVDSDSTSYTLRAAATLAFRGTGTETAGGRTTKNTDPFALGQNIGQSFRMVT